MNYDITLIPTVWVENQLKIQAHSILYTYMHVCTWSDKKILRFLAIVSIFNILLVCNQDFVMKTPLWLNSKN